ncbi:hypothetical protein BGX27_000087 [Mortierella sp. AM989]|nr:hypothetical protein BGX27_000087 [Mortierella sp. AM989]
MAKSKNAKKATKQLALQEESSQDSSKEFFSAQSSPSASSFTPLPVSELSSSSGQTSSSQPSESTFKTPYSSTSNGASSSAQASNSLDDMALELFMAKEAQSEVEQLRNQVARLKKEIEFKDAVIAKLQVESGSRQEISTLSATEKPTLSGTISHTVLEGSDSLTRHQQQQRDAALQCNICVDYFSSPFTVECGHTFCYTCLYSWLEIHKSCPTCRTKLLRRPTLSFNIREQVQSSISSLPQPEREVAMKKVQADENSLKRIQTNGDLWKGLFKPLGFEGLGNTIRDDDDGVSRCASCGWEVRGGVCTNCSTLFSDVGESDDSQDHTDNASEPDQYDSHDSFINDDEVEMENWSDNSSSDNDDGFTARLTRRRRSLGTRNGVNRRGPRPNNRLIRRTQAVVNISDDSGSGSEESYGLSPTHRMELLATGFDLRQLERSEESEESFGRSPEIEISFDDSNSDSGLSFTDNRNGQGEGGDNDSAFQIEESDEAEEILLTNRQKRRLQQSRRAVVVLDDDESEEKNNNTNKRKGKQVAVASTSAVTTTSYAPSTSSNVLSTKRAGSGSSTPRAAKNDSSEDTSDSDDDFVAPFAHKSKRQRSANLEALFN